MIKNLIIIFGLIGLFDSVYIFMAKKGAGKIACAISDRESCDAVIRSKYNKTAGIPNEILGIIYYGFIILLFVGAVFFPVLYSPILLNLAIGASFIAVLFSAYFIYIQARVLKQWCEWCIISALSSLFLAVLIYLL